MCGMKCTDTASMHNSLKATFPYVLYYIPLTTNIYVCVCKQCTYDNTVLLVVNFKSKVYSSIDIAYFYFSFFDRIFSSQSHF